MQIIVSKPIVALTQSLVGEFKLALDGNDSARILGSGDLPVIDKAMWNVVPLQGDEYSIVVDDEIVHEALHFYFGCVRILGPFVKLLAGFNEMAEATTRRINDLLQR